MEDTENENVEAEGIDLLIRKIKQVSLLMPPLIRILPLEDLYRRSVRVQIESNLTNNSDKTWNESETEFLRNKLEIPECAKAQSKRNNSDNHPYHCHLMPHRP